MTRGQDRVLVTGIVAAAAILVVGGAACGGGSEISLSHAWEILPDDRRSSEILSRKVLLFADNQVHHLYGEPFLQRSVFTDKHVSGTAIRPPQLDLFGQDLFRWALGSQHPDMPVIHLGDALDLACEGEFDEFAAIMKESRRPWAMAPGNHDGFFFGNFDSTEHFWRKACDGGGAPLPKHQFIRRYVTEIAKRLSTLDRKFRDNPTAGSWRCQPQVEEDCFVQEIVWRIDTKSRWRSYLVQKVDLSVQGSGKRGAVAAILADSTQYPKNPRALALHAGQEGSILADQAATIRGMLDKARSTGEKIVMATHHPYHALSDESRDYMDMFMQEYHTLLMLSAHTHSGRYYTHGSGEHTWLELNIGSILDWPIEFRTLSFRRSNSAKGAGNGGIILASERIDVPTLWSKDLGDDVPDCRPEWEARPGESDYYLDYRTLSTHKPEPTQRAIYDNILAAYQRMFCHLPPKSVQPSATATGTAAGFANSSICVQQFNVPGGVPNAVSGRIQTARGKDQSLEQKRETLLWLKKHRDDLTSHAKKQRNDYSLCQAQWASKYEYRRARVPQASDEYILVPNRQGAE